MTHEQIAAQPAFPLPLVMKDRAGNPQIPVSGITRREYFAALALQGMLASDFMRDKEHGATSPTTRAHHALLYADALIAELHPPAQRI